MSRPGSVKGLPEGPPLGALDRFRAGQIIISAGDGISDLAVLRHGLSEIHAGERGRLGSARAAARLALIAAAPGQCGGLRGRLARRRRRGPEGLRAAGGAPARSVPRDARR